jgi:DNA invertase Pin-like site-specific DNA recombinase
MLIGYARVSTIDQSLDLQIRALTQVGCERIFTEKASGTRQVRPELEAALQFARAGDSIIVWRLDRLARSLRQLVDTVADLKARQVELRSLTEQIDTSTAGGNLTFHVFAALSEFERELMSERTRAGLEAARANGRFGGRPRALNDDDLAAARALLADQSISVSEVARRVGVSTGTLYRYLPAARGSAGESRRS